ncbi:CNX3 [Auxenochlorella protothecoides x Auxenochlorella symbiontica]
MAALAFRARAVWAGTVPRQVPRALRGLSGAANDSSVDELNRELAELHGIGTAPQEEPLEQPDAPRPTADSRHAERQAHAPVLPQQPQESPLSTSLTHVDDSGRARMVDVSQKPHTARTAVAGARVMLGRTVFDLIQQNAMKKGDVLSVAQLAGVMGAKQTASLIPLCHPLSLSNVEVKLALLVDFHALNITVTASTVGQTGVEMEALTGASIAALTVYDMCKAVSRELKITDIRLLHKSGGRSGDWTCSS